MGALLDNVARLKLRSKATSRLILLVGIGVIIAALAWDKLNGAANPQFGALQLLGCFVGVGILAVGILLSAGSAAPNSTTSRWAAALYLAACSFTLSVIWPTAIPTWVLLGYVAATCVLLPLHFGVLTLVGVGGLHVLLTWISQVKSGLTGLPVTVLDIKIATANPSGLWDALALPHWSRYLSTAVIGIALLSWLVVGLVTAGRFMMRRPWTGIGDTVVRIIVVGVFGLMMLSYLETLYADAAKDKSTWHPERVARLADRMGVLPFLAYSYHLESKSTGDIYRTDGDSSPPSAEEIRAAVLRYMDFESRTDSTSQLLPNILVVLAESTFDPGAVFRLEGEWNDELFRPGERTAANGLLRVNAVGGGTWITEFETIVGLDSRLFGYSGMYTHASLSPFVDRSLATYLRDYGYHTWAFFPNRGDFYNARNAYENYGFEKIFDSEDLGKGGWVENDIEVAASVQTVLGFKPDSPLFGYVLFLENHSPHECNPADAVSFSARFVDSADFTPNCALHEYLRRLGSTTSAVRSLVNYLAGIEARTARPFVLMVFGDHQPFTFSSSGGIQYDYSALRKITDTYTTFFHFISSVPGRRLRCCLVTPPAALLPTLLSGFVATSPDDVYLGINLWLYARCGSSAVRHDFANSMDSLNERTLDERTEVCQHAYDRALAWYRTSGIVRLGGQLGL